MSDRTRSSRASWLAGGFLHGSAVNCLGMLGMGRCPVRVFARDECGRIDLQALEEALRRLDGAPALPLATAGEVNAGEFDPVDALADLAERYGTWLHVDGAFGLFARVSPRTAALAAGVERADSVTVDGHKWLNVPYDCGFAFVRKPDLMARALTVWATLRAYGRAGCRAMVEHHLDLAARLAPRVDEAPKLDRLNERLGAAILEDGSYYAGTTTYAGHVALRPALVNWRTREEEVDGFVAVVRELLARL